MIEGICSHCKEDFNNCKCEQFHPNVLLIDKDEAQALYDYFLKRAGYISPEFDEAVLKFVKRLERIIGH